MALPLDDYSQSAAELAPFIEGYAHVGEVEKAYQLTMIAHRNDVFTNYMLFDLWGKVELEMFLREETLGYIIKVNHELDCR